ncbi:MAG: hypothetical protein QM817_27345 [Archangium sp.]
MTTRTVKFDELPARTRRAMFRALSTWRTKDADSRIIAFEVRTLARGLWKLGLVVGALGMFLTGRFVVSRIIEYKIGSDPVTFMIMAASVAAFAASLIQVVVNRLYPQAPWPLGSYLFAGHFVDADDGWLDITPTVPLGKPTLIERRRNRQYQSSELVLGEMKSIGFGNHERATKIAETYLERRARYAAAIEAQDLAAAEAEDPLAECALTGTWTAPGVVSDVPSVAARPRSTRARLIAGAIIGVIVGGGAHLLVNVLRVGMD